MLPYGIPPVSDAFTWRSSQYGQGQFWRLRDIATDVQFARVGGVESRLIQIFKMEELRGARLFQFKNVKALLI